MLRLPLVLALVAALVACTPPPERSSKADAAAPDHAIPAAATPTAATPTPTSATPDRGPSLELPAIPPLPSAELPAAAGGFELLEAGTEPRTLLRFDPPAGTRAEATLTVAMHVALGGTALPPMRQDPAPVDRAIAAEILERSSGERFAMRLRYQAELDQTLELDGRGRIASAAIEAPATTTAQQRKTLETVAQNLGQWLVELPAEAVGVGASWTSTRAVATGGLELEQTSLVRLVGRDEQRLTFEVEISQVPRTASFTPPGQTVALDLIEFTGRGAAVIVYDLDSPLPLALRAKVETRFSAATATEPVKQLDFDLGVELTLL